MKLTIELHSYHIRQKFLLSYVHNLKSQYRYPISLNLENMWIAIMRFTACNSSALLLHRSAVHQCYKTWLNYTALVPSSRYFLLLREDHLMRNCHHILFFSKEEWIPTGMGEQVQNHVKNLCFSFHLYLWYAHSGHLMINAVTYVLYRWNAHSELFNTDQCEFTQGNIQQYLMSLHSNNDINMEEIYELARQPQTYDRTAVQFGGIHGKVMDIKLKKIIRLFQVVEFGCPFSNCLHL